jgi:Holliday junction resolvase RusA-like endonuclease
MIEIVINGVPLPWKAPYVGSKGAYSPRYHEVQIFRKIIQDQYHGEIIDVAINCDLVFYMPIPKSVSKKKRQLMLSGSIRPEVTPDRTNMAKLYEDCLQGIVIKNDAKIVDGRISKYYSEVPRTVIVIEKVS